MRLSIFINFFLSDHVKKQNSKSHEFILPNVTFLFCTCPIDTQNFVQNMLHLYLKDHSKVLLSTRYQFEYSSSKVKQIDLVYQVYIEILSGNKRASVA